MSLLGNCCHCLQKLQDWDLLWNNTAEQWCGTEWYFLVHALLSYTNQVKLSLANWEVTCVSYKVKLDSFKALKSRRDLSVSFWQTKDNCKGTLNLLLLIKKKNKKSPNNLLPSFGSQRLIFQTCQGPFGWHPFCCFHYTMQLGVVSKLAEGALNPTVYVTDKDVEEQQSPDRVLENTSCDQPPLRCQGVEHNPLASTIQPSSIHPIVCPSNPHLFNLEIRMWCETPSKVLYKST